VLEGGHGRRAGGAADLPVRPAAADAPAIMVSRWSLPVRRLTMDTRTIAILALVIAVVLAVILLM